MFEIRIVRSWQGVQHKVVVPTDENKSSRHWEKVVKEPVVLRSKLKERARENCKPILREELRGGRNRLGEKENPASKAPELKKSLKLVFRQAKPC